MISRLLRRYASNTGKPITAPGNLTKEMATQLEQSVGIERYELLAELQGKKPFLPTEIAAKSMGTLTAPILVPSLAESRIVGCRGSESSPHEICWWEQHVKSDPGRCRHCGNAIQIEFQK